MERNDLIERLRKRAEDEREIQRNNEAVADALSGQLEAFHRRDGSHNNFAVRLGLDHRSCAKKDASLAADWDEAAATIASLSEALAEAEKKGAVQAAAFKLTADDQFELATAVAANLGFDLTPEPPHPDAPGLGMFEAAAERAFASSGDDAAVVTRDDYRAAYDLSQEGKHG